MPKISRNVLEANDILLTEDNKTNNANTSNENRKSAPKNKRNKDDQNKIVTAIVDDCMIKDYGWKLSDKDEKVAVKHFSRSTTEDMKTYIQLSLKRDPDRVIIHLGRNDLKSCQDPETIAKDIIDIAKNSTTDKNEILVSSIVSR